MWPLILSNWYWNVNILNIWMTQQGKLKSMWCNLFLQLGSHRLITLWSQLYKTLLTGSKVIWQRSVPISFDQIRGEKTILAAFSSSNGDQKMLLNVFRTWFVFKNKLSIIKCLFLDMGVDLAWSGLSSTFRAGPATQLQNSQIIELTLDQTLGFSNSKHPITF